MEHNVKIVIGANYGDEGKGLMSRYFTKQFKEDGKRPITVLHNGSAQRGHTADYEDGSRHVFHNFGAGAKDGSATYYACSFLVHPMDFCREVKELGHCPKVFADPRCVVVTPWDMLADHIIEDYIAVQSGAREYGSCGYGTWSATDRMRIRPDIAYTIQEYKTKDYTTIAAAMRSWVEERLKNYGVNLDLVPHWKPHFDPKSPQYRNTAANFKMDMMYFLSKVPLVSLNYLWRQNDSFIFEGAQGLLLDQDRDSIWTTTSKTGLFNPFILLYDYRDFHAEVCYVSRAYVTRHGEGPLDGEVDKSELGENIHDRTNVFNDFQGGLRYAHLSKRDMEGAILGDYLIADNRYDQTLALTHCNEHDTYGGDYRSYSTTKVIKA